MHGVTQDDQGRGTLIQSVQESVGGVVSRGGRLKRGSV